MVKNKRIIISIFSFFIMVFIATITFANEGIGDKNIVNNQSVTENKTPSQEIHEGDLYLTEDNVNMDKIVNGNVYIIGKDVNITGQIGGNLFVLANKVNFKDAYIESSAYICANEVYFQAIASDLYVCSSTLEIPSDYGVYRDLKCYSKSSTILGLVGRNAEINTTSLTLEKEDAKASIYGDLNYSCQTEANIPDGTVEGAVNYHELTKASNNKKTFNIMEFIIKACSAIIFTLVIYGLTILFNKELVVKCTKILENKLLPAFGIGILALILVPIASIIFMISIVGVPVAIVLLVLYGLLLSISSSAFSIVTANIVCNKVGIVNNWLKALMVGGISLLVYIISIIPYVSILGFFIVILGFGTIIMTLFFKKIINKKEDKAEK